MAALVWERWRCLGIILAAIAGCMALAAGWQMLFPITLKSYENCVLPG